MHTKEGYVPPEISNHVYLKLIFINLAQLQMFLFERLLTMMYDIRTHTPFGLSLSPLPLPHRMYTTFRGQNRSRLQAFFFHNSCH
jgi:hypothetical protein